MHATKAHAFVPTVDAADDDVRGNRRGVGVAVAEEAREEGAEVIAVEVFGAQDDGLAQCGLIPLHLTLRAFGD